MNQEKEYYAFISYKREDEKWAKWLQQKLEHYKLPSNLNGRTDLPREIRPVFRDTSELNPGNLPQQIYDALAASKHLIAICSPRSAQSEWVNKEVETFIAMGKQGCIIPFIIDGRPYAEDQAEECFPPAIRNLPKEQELLGANISEMCRDAAAVKTVAQMFGIRFDTLWKRHEREQKRKRAIVIIAVVLFVLAVLGVAGWILRKNEKMEKAISRAVTEASLRVIEDGDSFLARKLAIAAWDIDHSSQAEAALRKACQHTSTVLRGHVNRVTSAFFSPNKKRIISSSFDKTIRVWDTYSGRCIQTIRGHRGRVSSACYSPDGKFILSASHGFESDSTIRIWDASTGRCLKIINMPCRYFSIPVYSQNGKMFLSTIEDTVFVWNVDTWHLIRKFECEKFGVLITIKSDKNHGTAITRYGNYIKMWDLNSGKCIKKQKLQKEENWLHGCTAISSDNQWYVSSCLDTVKLYRVNTGHLVSNEVIKDDMGCPMSIFFSPTNNQLLVTTSYGRVQLREVPSMRLLQTIDVNVGSEDMDEVNYSPDGTHIVATMADNTIRIFEIPYNEKDFSLFINRYGHSCISFSNDGNFIATANRDVYGPVKDSICIWDASTGRLLLTLEADGQRFRSMSFSPNDSCLVTVSEDWSNVTVSDDNSDLLEILTNNPIGEIRVWDLSTCRCLRSMVGHTNEIKTAEYSPNSNIIVSASMDSTIRIWDAVSGNCLRVLKGHTAGIKMASFCPIGKIIVSASEDSTARIWDVSTGRCILTIKMNDKVESAVYSPDCKSIVTSSSDVISIWSATTGKKIRQMFGGGNVGFDSDGKYVISSGFRGFCNIWDFSSGLCVSTTQIPSIIDAKFEPNGKHYAISTKYDGVKIFDFPLLHELIDETRARFKDNPLTPEERRKYYLE